MIQDDIDEIRGLGARASGDVAKADFNEFGDIGRRASAGAAAGGAIGAAAGIGVSLLLRLLGLNMMRQANWIVGGAAALGATAGGIRAGLGEDVVWKEIGDDLMRALGGAK